MQTKFAQRFIIRPISSVYNKIFATSLKAFNEKKYIENMNQIQSQQKIYWPLFQRVELIEDIAYFFSRKYDEFGYQTNLYNLSFCIGAKENGKSWLLKSALRDNENVILMNSNNYHSLDHFFRGLKQLMIQRFCANPELNLEILKDIVLLNKDPKYINIFFNQVLETLDQNTSSFIQLNDQQIQLLAEYRITEGQKLFQQDDSKINQSSQNSPILLEEEIQTIKHLEFQQHFIKIVQLLDHKNQIEVGFNIILTLMEIMERDQAECSHILKTNFLFDVMNYLSGIQYPYISTDANLNDLKQIRSYGIVFLNFDHLFSKYPYNKQAQDFYDHIILRLYNDKGIRNHFPIMIESQDSSFCNREIFEMLSIDTQNYFGGVDVYEVPLNEIRDNIGHILNTKDFQKVYQLLGGNLKDWQYVIEKVVQDENFNLEQWIEQIQIKENNLEYNKFENMINQVYCHAEIYDLLDSDQIDDQLIQILKLLIKWNGNLFTGRYYNDIVLLSNPLVNALQKIGILFQQRYISQLRVSKQIYISFIKIYLQELEQRVKQKLTVSQYLKRLIKLHKPLQESVLKTKFFSFDPKTRGVTLLIDLKEPRTHTFRLDGKGLRPWHQFLHS